MENKTMVETKFFKNSIEIRCKPIVSYEFKDKLIKNLSIEYLLKSNDKLIHKIDKIAISDAEQEELLNFYKQNDFKYSFEEFIELYVFPIDVLDIFTTDDKKIATIDFMPDGDDDSIWIDIYTQEHKQKLISLIQELI